MSIVKQYHKESNTTYVYESQSYWDAEKKQSRSKRRLIGKVDPITGDIIPTGKRGRKSSKPQPVSEEQVRATEIKYEQSQWRLASQEKTLQDQEQRIHELEQRITLMEAAMQKAAVTLERARNMLVDVSSK